MSDREIQNAKRFFKARAELRRHQQWSANLCKRIDPQTGGVIEVVAPQPVKYQKRTPLRIVKFRAESSAIKYKANP
jgi:hypothetical protein